MTVANDIIFLSLRNSGVTGVGQTPLPDDVNDALTILNAWINEINLERTVKVNRVTLPVFPDLTTDVSFWTPYQHVLLTSMAVRLRQIYSLPAVQLDVQLAASAMVAFNAINLEQIAAPAIAANDGTGYGVIFLALRAAGRVKDDQGVLQTSQDVTDAASLMTEMLDEWQRMRTVRVIPGTFPVITNLSAPLTLDPGVRNAIVLNLAVRLRDAFGAEVSKTLFDRAANALELVQANNQQQVAPIHGGIPETVDQALFLALRMAGRITDQQSVSDTSKDVNDAFSLLVMMLAQWQRKRWLTWNEQQVSLISNGANFYTIGPGQDFDTPRPDKLHAAWVRLQPSGEVGRGVVRDAAVHAGPAAGSERRGYLAHHHRGERGLGAYRDQRPEVDPGGGVLRQRLPGRPPLLLAGRARELSTACTFSSNHRCRLTPPSPICWACRRSISTPS